MTLLTIFKWHVNQRVAEHEMQHEPQIGAMSVACEGDDILIMTYEFILAGGLSGFAAKPTSQKRTSGKGGQALSVSVTRDHW